MINLLQKELVCGLKLKAIGILVQVHDDDFYTKQKLVHDLTELVKRLDILEEDMKPIQD